MRKNVTLKKFANLRTKPAPLKKGVTYSIEKVSDSNDFIAKKYVNGKLFKQKIVSDKKMKDLVQKQMKKMKQMKQMKNKTAKRGGETRPAEPVQPGQPVQVQIQPRTLWEIIKEGFGFGAGWALGEGLIDALFDS